MAQRRLGLLLLVLGIRETEMAATNMIQDSYYWSLEFTKDPCMRADRQAKVPHSKNDHIKHLHNQAFEICPRYPGKGYLVAVVVAVAVVLVVVVLLVVDP